MATWRPDPSFYPSPRLAAKAPAESIAYVATFDPDRQRPDAIAVVDLDPGSPSYSCILETVPMPNLGDELHHFGWNACSSCLCPNAPHPHVERRYLVVPGLRSSRIHILDTKPDPRRPHIVKVIEPEEMAEKTGYTRPHTVHCGPGGIYVAALGSADGGAPGGVFLMDHESFEPLGRWEVERGPQLLAYDAWWHLGYDTMVTSDWGTPETFENGLIPEVLLGSRLRAQAALLGRSQPPAPSGDRLRRGAPARLRAPSGSRPDQALWLR
jgi:methanethiol oxidase